jgi:outer membrane cobalamin receptor
LDNQTTWNKILPYRPQHLMKATVSATYKNFHIKLNYNHIGKRYVNEANTQFIDDYRIWNADVNWNQPIGRMAMTLKLSMLNFTDENYTIVRDMPMPGRQWRLGVLLSY